MFIPEAINDWMLPEFFIPPQPLDGKDLAVAQMDAREEGRLLSRKQMLQLVDEDEYFSDLFWEARIEPWSDKEISVYRGDSLSWEDRLEARLEDPLVSIPRQEFVFCSRCDGWAEREIIKDPHYRYEAFEYCCCGVCRQILGTRTHPDDID